MPRITEPPLVDPAILESYRVLQDDGEPDIVTEFIDTFLEDLPQRLDAIRAAVTGKSAGEIRSTAHALKGSAASIGAAQLAALCSTLEMMGRAGELSESGARFAEIEVATAAATAALADYRDPAVSPPPPASARR